MPTARKLTRKEATEKPVRRSVSLTPDIDTKIQRIARHQNRSANQVIESLIATGLKAKEAEKRRFFELADRLRTASDETELRQIKDQLARLTFGA